MKTSKLVGVLVVLTVLGLSFGDALTGHGIRGNKNLNPMVVGDGSTSSSSTTTNTTNTEGEGGDTTTSEKEKTKWDAQITTVRKVTETYKRDSDGAKCEKFETTITGKCVPVGTADVCVEYVKDEEGISCTVIKN